MRRILILCSVLAACHPAPARTVTFPHGQLGTYRFTERLGRDGPGGSQTVVIDGVVTITPDTVMIDMSPGPCRYEERSVASASISYRCADVTVAFDRSNPLMRASYMTTLLESVPVRVCVRYVTNAAGQQTCAQYGTEYQERRVVRSGLLRLNRAG